MFIIPPHLVTIEIADLFSSFGVDTYLFRHRYKRVYQWGYKSKKIYDDYVSTGEPYLVFETKAQVEFVLALSILGVSSQEAYDSLIQTHPLTNVPPKHELK